jgi:hypothetical protein
MMSKGNYHSQIFKRSVPVGISTKSAASSYCSCPGSEPGKINIDASAHLSGCWIRKRLVTGQYTTDTSIISEQYNDGCSLGVVLTAID